MHFSGGHTVGTSSMAERFNAKPRCRLSPHGCGTKTSRHPKPSETRIVTEAVVLQFEEPLRSLPVSMGAP